MDRRIVIAGFVASFILGGIIVWAIQSNWYEVADLTGTVKKNEVTITTGHIILGNINSGTTFQGNCTTSLGIPVTEDGGQNITKFFVVTPVTGTTNSIEYLQERFFDLSLNVTINAITQTVPIVVAGDCEYPSGDLHHEDTDYDNVKTWFSFEQWTVIFLATGSHDMNLTAFGKTSAPSVDLTINLIFGIELT